LAGPRPSRPIRAGPVTGALTHRACSNKRRSSRPSWESPDGSSDRHVVVRGRTQGGPAKEGGGSVGEPRTVGKSSARQPSQLSATASALGNGRSRSRMPNAECRMPNAECRMPKPKPNAECRMPQPNADVECRSRSRCRRLRPKPDAVAGVRRRRRRPLPNQDAGSSAPAPCSIARRARPRCRP
jgi:hypothetical protein